MQQAIDYEVQWQIDLIEDGGTVRQATVLFDSASGETRAMRSKEDAHDYRYFPDPDLPPLVIDAAWVERVRAQMPELPAVMAARFERDYGLAVADAALMTQSKAFAAYFEAAAKASAQPKLVANWMMGELSRRLHAQGLEIDASPVGAPALAAMIARIGDGTISNSGARRGFDALWTSCIAPGAELAAKGAVHSTASAALTVDALIDTMGLKQMSNSGELERLIDAVLAANPKSVEEYRAGKDKAFNALVGQAMKATKGKGNPAQVGEWLKKKLAG